MSHTTRLRRNPGTFRQLTGITPAVFDQLLAELEPRHRAAEAKRQTRRPRQRKPGAGPKHTLDLADRLLMLLMYYRTYTTHAFLAFLFGLDDSNVGRNMNPLQPLLAGVFRIPERRVEWQPDEIRELFFDATERPIPRPTRGQETYYSGKKKRHTVKHQVVVVRKRKTPGRAGQTRRVRIAAVSKMFPGKTHDKKVYDRTRVVCPPGVKRTGDTAYQGTGLDTPTRRPRKGALTARQKAGNRRVSKRRIVVEHGIGKMKIWRIAGERYRNRRRGHTLMMKNVAGLHNRMFG
jgi:DDE superfamily endonuclease/Helix-turn-helix of DDE superfamily endonuclease